MNTNKANYYVENETLKITLQNQRLIIANLEKELQKKSMTIDYLSQQLIQQQQSKNTRIVTNLLDFD
jgi:hypothetical protein